MRIFIKDFSMYEIIKEVKVHSHIASGGWEFGGLLFTGEMLKK
jgi:hypothetical protein